MKPPTVPDTLTDALALAILTELPRFGTNNAATILDVIAVWAERGYAGNRIQDALEHLWDLKLVCIDDDETPPIYPRCSVLFSSPGGDAFVGHRAQEVSTIPERFVEGLQRLKAARGLKNKDLAAGIGVSEAYVSNMMGGKRDVKLTMLERLRVKMGVTVLDMFGPEPDQARIKREWTLITGWMRPADCQSALSQAQGSPAISRNVQYQVGSLLRWDVGGQIALACQRPDGDEVVYSRRKTMSKVIGRRNHLAQRPKTDHKRLS